MSRSVPLERLVATFLRGAAGGPCSVRPWRRWTRRGAPELPDAVAAAGERGPVPGHNVKRTFGGDGTYLQKRPFPLGPLRGGPGAAAGSVGRGGGAPACTMVAPGARGPRPRRAALRRGTSGPGARRPVLPSSRRTRGASPTHALVTRAADGPRLAPRRAESGPSEQESGVRWGDQT